MSTTKLRPPFSRNLRHLLHEERMTQQFLARKLDVSVRAVSAWCTGENIPHRRTAERLSRLFVRTVDWFYEEHGFGA